MPHPEGGGLGQGGGDRPGLLPVGEAGPALDRLLLPLQAVTALGFKQPTPIQKACIPVGLLGKDVCACAATGTGEWGRGRRGP